MEIFTAIYNGRGRGDGYDAETLESAEEAIQEAEAIQSAIQSDHGITLEIEVR